jgi:hypothetical protein
MPTETAIVVAGIVFMFAAFVVALASIDYYARNFRAPDATYFHQPDAKE